jgi:hypothetical protein
MYPRRRASRSAAREIFSFVVRSAAISGRSKAQMGYSHVRMKIDLCVGELEAADPYAGGKEPPT